jgi:hypothetical protein
MIKQIKSTEDINTVIGLLEEFLEETFLKDKLVVNKMHLGKLIHNMIYNHCIWIAEIDGETAGMFLAIKQPNVWDPSYMELREMAWFVRPKYRSGQTAGRLFFEYCRFAEKLKNEGKIQGYTVSSLSTTENLDLESRGFKIIEQTYLKD